MVCMDDSEHELELLLDELDDDDDEHVSDCDLLIGYAVLRL